MTYVELLLLLFPIGWLLICIIGVKKPAGQARFFETPFSMDLSSALKGAAATGIILHHLTQNVTKYGSHPMGPVTFFNEIGILFTSIFFFLSGYGLIRSYFSKKDYFSSFLQKRLPHVLIPFFVSNVIYYLGLGIYFGYLKDFYHGHADSALDAVVSLSGFLLLNTNTWFLVEITILYLLFYLIYTKIKKEDAKLKWMFAASLLLILFSLLLGHDPSKAGNHWFMGEWWYNTTILFPIGMLFAKQEQAILAFVKKHYRVLAVFSAILFFALLASAIYANHRFGYYQEWSGHPGYGEKLFTLMMQSLACTAFIFALMLLFMKRKIGNRMLSFLGEISLELYIIHHFVMVYALQDARISSPEPVLFLVVCVFSTILAYFLHRFDQCMIRLWIGRKAYFHDIPDTVEGKMYLQRIKYFYKLAKRVCIVFVAVLLFLSCVQLYDVLFVPRQVYQQELRDMQTVAVGDEIYFGSYDLEYIDAGYERLPWIVLDKQDDKLLLLSKYVLCASAFNQSHSNSSWEACTVRKLINEQGYDMIFNSYEQKHVVPTTVSSVNADQSTTTTTDFLFLLSAEEVQQYLPTDASRIAFPSVIAAERLGVNVQPVTGNTWWWLRDMTDSAMKAAVVWTDGTLPTDSRYVNVADGGVRPAVWIKCDH